MRSLLSHLKAFSSKLLFSGSTLVCPYIYIVPIIGTAALTEFNTAAPSIIINLKSTKFSFRKIKTHKWRTRWSFSRTFINNLFSSNQNNHILPNSIHQFHQYHRNTTSMNNNGLYRFHMIQTEIIIILL